MDRAPWRDPRRRGFESHSFRHILSASHFAAQNVPIKILGKEEVVGSNPTAEGLYLRIAQSGRAPKIHSAASQFLRGKWCSYSLVGLSSSKGMEDGVQFPYTPRH